MKTKLAGRHLTLQEMITQTIESSQTKMASVQEDEKADRVKKLLAYEKSEHGGHIPSVKEEKAEKTASINPMDPDQIEKLASALNHVGDELIKESSVNNGGESHQGGMQIETNNMVSGTQSYKKDSSKSHNVPMSTGMQAASDNGKGKTQVPNDHDRAPGGSAGSLLNSFKTASPTMTATPPGMSNGKKGAIGAAAALGTAALAAGGHHLYKKHQAKKEVPNAQVPSEGGEHAAGGTEPIKTSSVQRMESAVEKLADYGAGKDESTLDRAQRAGRRMAALGAVAGGLRGSVAGGATEGARGAVGGAALGAATGGISGYLTGRLQNRIIHGKASEHDRVTIKDDRATPPSETPSPEPKTAAALDFILGKIAESQQGGETLDSKSGEGVTVPSGGSNIARSHISSNEAAVSMKKVDGKKPQKRMLSEVLTEPALSSAHDSKVQDNLRNATKGGVKIAASKAYLQKIASDPSDPRHEQLMAAMKNMKNGK